MCKQTVVRAECIWETRFLKVARDSSSGYKGLRVRVRMARARARKQDREKEWQTDQ